ncbi:hypothetical protein CEXT_785751 [Caerostris extrusa]|uniref:Uncharacterized protein n=1 Tax=Caerostris extrusa TaxID=172846 RepID=A0AAV4X5R1_CAEEX|nr:hypothetical protein CEXT_785751 [Caerostris extrusa]
MWKKIRNKRQMVGGGIINRFSYASSLAISSFRNLFLHMQILPFGQQLSLLSFCICVFCQKPYELFATASTSESYLFNRISHSSNYDDFAPSSTPVIQPRLNVAEPSEYVPSGTPVLQPRGREEEYFKSTADSPSMQPQLTSNVQYRTTETFRDEPWPSTEKLRSPSDDESITIQPELDSKSYLIITESETTKPSLIK